MYFKSIKINLDEIKNILKKILKRISLSEIVFDLNIEENFDEKLKKITQSMKKKVLKILH